MSLSVQIEKSFKGFNLDVAFEAGQETLGLLGQSGCGKSLTMRCVAGIETPDAGKIVVNGTVFFDKAHGKKPKVNLSAQQRKTALLFQNYMLFPNLTVEQNVASGIHKSVPAHERAQLVKSELVRFGIEHFASRYPAQLSGGQQQRVALARMLAAQPGILMLDEPFSALDAHLKSMLEINLTRTFEAFGGTILYVSHDIDEALRFCDRIAVMDDGHILEMGQGNDLVNRPQSEAGIKLSGCGNVTEAQRVGEHEVHLPKWGITVTTEQVVPHDVKAFGVRDTHLRQVDQPGPNVYRVVCDRVSDSRFERMVLLGFVDSERTNQGEVENEMSFLHQHATWRIRKDEQDLQSLPQQGQELFILIPPHQVYLVSR